MNMATNCITGAGILSAWFRCDWLVGKFMNPNSGAIYLYRCIESLNRHVGQSSVGFACLML